MNFRGMSPFLRIETLARVLVLSAALFAGSISTAEALDGYYLEAKQVAAGQAHTCAILPSGQVACWGGYVDSSLNTGDEQVVPKLVDGLDDAVSISARGAVTCAVRASGQAECWGDNSYGRLGDGTTTDRLAPTPVLGLSDAKSISVGGNGQVCAIRESGQAVCWGANYDGQLGDGTTTDRLVPTPVSGLSDAKSISAGGDYPCAIRKSGQAVCWGGNLWTLGGDNEGSYVPVPIAGLSSVKAITSGSSFICAVLNTGQAVCLGYGGWGRQGDGSNSDNTVATPVSGLSDAVSISSGYWYSCAIRTSGQVVCWGDNRWGALGDGTFSNSNVPVAVPGLIDAVSVVAGAYHTCAIRESSELYCWGYNSLGGLGDGSKVNRSLPGPVQPVPPETRTLTVSKSGAGQGTITSDPTGIYCGSQCWKNFDIGTVVTLTAVAAEGSSFAGWSGECSGTGSCQVTLDEARSVSAAFDVKPPPPPTHALTVAIAGAGKGRVLSSPSGIDCGTDCSEDFDEGTEVTLTAAADSGTDFAGWSGACSGTGSCKLSMTQARTVTATFAPSVVLPLRFRLQVVKSGSGQGTVKSSPAGIECGSTCQGEFAGGTVVTLSATPEAGSVFAGWTGACAGATACQVTMDQARTVNATFSAKPVGRKPSIGKLKVSPKRKTVRRAKSIVFVAKFRNTGDSNAAGLRVCGKGPARVIKPKIRCATVGVLRPGRVGKVRLRFSVKGSARKGSTVHLRFSLTSGDLHRRGSAALKVK